MREAIKKLIIENYNNIASRDDLEALKRRFCKNFNLRDISNTSILEVYRELLAKQIIFKSFSLEKILKKRTIRTMSGIAPVAVLTKPYPCPGACAYCPRQKNVPVSYLDNEPAVMRAIRCGYDPYKQIILRLKSLEDNGHEPNKIEVIVIGGTWSYLPKKYQYWFIASCFQAANDYQKINKNKKEKNFKLTSKISRNLNFAELNNALLKEQKKNEKARYKIIGLTLETRPDFINEKELIQMRELGCTRVEIGVQAIDDKILKKNKRGHDTKAIIKATKLLKSYGFKITYHFMPALPGSNPDKDLEMFKDLFAGDNFQPDQIKFYPTVVTQGSLLYNWHKKGVYKPYTDQQLSNLIIACKKIIPPYVRIIRLIRDIPGESIIAGNKITNLRQIMQSKGVKCNCIRCREVKDGRINKYKLNTLEYQASGGREYFISLDSFDKKVLYGFCRLRLDNNSPISPAIIRELHVYGQLVPVGSQKIIQHSGFGKKLLAVAEKIAKEQNINKIAVISGIGVRSYYRKLGYKKNKTYLIKKI